jgi:hypothetical protein
VKYGLTSTKAERISVQIPRNAQRVTDVETAYFSTPMLIVVLAACVIALGFRPCPSMILLALSFALLASISVIGTRIWLRYVIPATPFILMTAAIGFIELARLLARWKLPAATLLPLVITGVWAVLFCIPFHWMAYTDPPKLPLPPGDRTEYIAGIASGYGIKDAVKYVLDQIKTPTTVWITAANCQGASMYVPYDSLMNLYCPGVDWAGFSAMNQKLVENMAAYVKLDGPIYLISEYANIIPESALPRPFVRVAEFQRNDARGWFAVRVYRIEGSQLYLRPASEP